MVHPVFIQTFYYGVLMIITIGIVGLIMKGFYRPYMKVRLSFGKYVLVKIRNALRDHYAVGWIEDGFLVFKLNKQEVRMGLPSSEKKFIYKSIGVNWIDIDEEKWAFCMCDYTPVKGFDGKKFSDLLTRALMRPTVSSNLEKILIGGLILLVILGFASAYLSFVAYKNTQIISVNLPNYITALNQGAKVVGSSIL